MAYREKKHEFPTFEEVKESWDNVYNMLSTKRAMGELTEAYYDGDQNLKIENGRVVPRINQYTFEPTVNLMQIGCRTLRANLLKSRPLGEPKPNGSNQKSVMAAKAGDSLVRLLADTSGYHEALQSAVGWGTRQGTCGVKLGWDRSAVDELGMPLTSGLKVRSVMPWDVMIDPTAQVIDDARWLTHRTIMDVEAAEDMYDKEFEADAMEATRFARGTLSDKRARKEALFVYEHWRRPCRRYPKGILLTYINGKEAMAPTEWDFPDWPFVIWPFETPNEGCYGDTPCWQGTFMQSLVNRCIAAVTEYIRKMPLVTLTMEKGSIDEGKEMRPRPFGGVEVLEYNATAREPKPLTMQAPPQFVFNFIQELLKLNEIVTGISSALQGRAPFAQISGRGLAYLLEADQTVLGPITQNLGKATVKIAKWMVELYRKYGPEPINLWIPAGVTSGEWRQFYKADLDWRDIVWVEGSLLNRSDTVFVDSIKEFVPLGILTPQEAKQALVNRGIINDEDPYADNVERARANIRSFMDTGILPPIETFWSMPVHVEEWASWGATDEFNNMPEGPQKMAARDYIAQLQRKLQERQNPQAAQQPPAPGAQNQAPAAEEPPPTTPAIAGSMAPGTGDNGSTGLNESEGMELSSRMG